MDCWVPMGPMRLVLDLNKLFILYEQSGGQALVQIQSPRISEFLVESSDRPMLGPSTW